MDGNLKSSLIDKIYSSTVYRVGTVIGLGVALVTAPLAFPPVQNTVFPKKPQITIQIKRESPAFDVDRQFSGLSVIYQGRDLVASKSGLLIAQVRIANTGSTSISETNISRSDPLGVRVNHGQILGIIGTSATSDHLRRRAAPTVRDNVIYVPSNIILDPEDYIGFDVLILKPDDVAVEFTPVGKIEGVKNIVLDRHDASDDQPPMIASAFGGGVYVQILRILGYALFAIIIAIFTIGAIVQTGEFRDRFRRRKRKKDLRPCSKSQFRYRS